MPALACLSAAMFIATLVELDRDTRGKVRVQVILLGLFTAGWLYALARDPAIAQTFAGYFLTLLAFMRATMLIGALKDRLATWRDV